MADDPFTPVFGGKPTAFFGRAYIMRAFERAMSNRGSGTPALFVAGSRGYGKTALLEQLSMRAKALGRKQGQTSAARGCLISNGIVIAPQQGRLMFAIPYLADFLVKNTGHGRSGLDAVREWRM